jgi:hypothetical protein
MKTIATTLALAALLAVPAPGLAQTTGDATTLITPLESEAGTGPSLKLSGFADFGYLKFVYDDPRWEDEENIPKHGAFSIGNLNLYLDGRLDERFRGLVEVRFSYLPNGVALQGSASGSLETGTRVIDPAQLRATAQWGGVVVERAWVEYRQSQLLTLRGGQFLTPYGVWNVDHGSPTLIDVAPPFVIGQELLPKTQLGVEALGSAYLGDARIGYHLTASNGRIGNNPQFLDFDSNFGFGGRVFVEGNWLGDVKLGASAYSGKTLDKREGLTYSVQDLSPVVGLPPGSVMLPVYLPFSQERRYDELGWGLDLRWDWKGAVVVAEYIQQRLSNIETTSVSYATGAPVESVSTHADFDKSGYYVIAGYTLPGAVMPFVMYQYINDATNSLNETNAGYGLTGGINWRVRPNVVLKASYTHTWFPNASDDAVNSKPLDWFASQVAWAF